MNLRQQTGGGGGRRKRRRTGGGKSGCETCNDDNDNDDVRTDGEGGDGDAENDDEEDDRAVTKKASKRRQKRLRQSSPADTSMPQGSGAGDTPKEIKSPKPAAAAHSKRTSCNNNNGGPTKGRKKAGGGGSATSAAAAFAFIPPSDTPYAFFGSPFRCLMNHAFGEAAAIKSVSTVLCGACGRNIPPGAQGAVCCNNVNNPVCMTFGFMCKQCFNANKTNPGLGQMHSYHMSRKEFYLEQQKAEAITAEETDDAKKQTICDEIGAKINIHQARWDNDERVHHCYRAAKLYGIKESKKQARKHSAMNTNEQIADK